MLPRGADVTRRDLDGSDLQCSLVHTEVELAPKAFLDPAVLAGVPLTFAFRLDPGRIDQEAQGACSATIRDGNVQRFLPPTQGAEIRHLPVGTSQPQQSLDEPCCLAKRQTEQNLHCQANLDCSVAELGLTTAPTRRSRVPRHLGIKPDCKRTALLQRRVARRPVPGLVLRR